MGYVTENTLKFFKQKYYGHKIIYVRFSNEEFIFRTLNKNEYKYIKTQSSTQEDLQDNICIMACVYPEEYDFNYCHFAGLPKFVAPQIEQLSGFTDIDVILQSYYQEKENNTLEAQCMDMIKAFIPEYTYEEMQEWTWEHLMITTARAEKVAKLKGFDYHLNDKSKELEDEYNKMNSDNPDFIKNLYESGIDPMMHFANELKLKHNVVDFPLILGKSYNNEEVLDAVRKQIKEKKIANTKRYL